MIDDPRIVSALIAAVVSLVVSGGTIWAARFRAASERRQQERELERKLTERLYEERIKTYRRAFGITQGLLGHVVNKEDLGRDEVDAVADDLADWVAQDAAFILSRRSLEAYYRIRDALRVEPAEGDDRYTEKQRREMWHAKNELRRALRYDVRLLFLEDSREPPEGA